ncbi:MAG: MATE family efflux transporter [Oscillospiraceae bacterium]|nr:MATE family efflux transporter [Oscillospiraceae bacterium]
MTEENAIESDGLAQNPLGTDPIRKLIPHYAVPATIALVVNALYNIVDQIFIGQTVGYLGNAATNIVNPLMVIMLAVAILWGDGCSSYASLQLGRGNRESASRGVCNAFLMSFILGLVIMAISLIFMKPLCLLFGASENSLSYAMQYGYIIVLGFPFMAILNPVTSCIRVDGGATYGMVGLLVACGSNILLDALFCIGFGWGVKGAAFATLLGQTINVIWVLAYIPRFKTIDIKKEYFRPNFQAIKTIAGLGVSTCVLQLSYALIYAIANNMLAIQGELSKYGSDITVAAIGITIKVNQVVVNVVQGIITGSQPIIGYNYGAGKYERTKKTFKIAVISSAAFMALATIVFEGFPMSIISLFGSESELYNEFAVMCIRIFLMLCVCNGLQTCTSIFFQSVGRPRQAFVNTFVKQILLVPVGMVALAYTIGVTGPLWAEPIADGIAFIISVVLLRIYWKKIFSEEKSSLLS